MTRHWALYTPLWEWNTINFLHQEKAHKITFASEDIEWEWKDEELFNCRKNSFIFSFKNSWGSLKGMIGKAWESGERESYSCKLNQNIDMEKSDTISTVESRMHCC